MTSTMTSPRNQMYPRVARDGTVELPTFWSILARTILTSTDNEDCVLAAVELATQVLTASERSFDA